MLSLLLIMSAAAPVQFEDLALLDKIFRFKPMQSLWTKG